MSNEQNKPVEAQELTEKELAGIVGGEMLPTVAGVIGSNVSPGLRQSFPAC